MLTRVPGRQTGDIDIVSEGLNDTVRDASRTVAARHNLTPAWINDGVTGIYDEDELLDLIETAAGVRGLRPRDEYWAKEMLVRARKGRRMRSLRGVAFPRSVL